MVWGWVCKGGGGRPPFKNTLAFGASHKDQKHKTQNHRIRRMFNCKCCCYQCKPQSTQLSSIRNIYHPCCNIYPKAPFERTLTSPTPHSATCNPTQSHAPFGSEHSNLDFGLSYMIEWTASHLGTPTRMGLGHSTSPVLSTHVILLGIATKSHIFSSPFRLWQRFKVSTKIW